MNILHTVSLSIISIMILGIFTSGVVYSAEQVNDTTPVKEVLFWSALMLLFVGQIYRGLSDIGDQIKEYTQSKSKTHSEVKK